MAQLGSARTSELPRGHAFMRERLKAHPGPDPCSPLTFPDRLIRGYLPQRSSRRAVLGGETGQLVENPSSYSDCMLANVMNS